MLIEKLQKRQGFTNAENVLADYILNHADEVVEMTTRDLASAAFVSSPTVIRLCKKTGIKGFNNFKVQLSRELTDIYRKNSQVDTNYPFTNKDNRRVIADKLARLSMNCIVSTNEQIDYIVIAKIVYMIRTNRYIDIYGCGLSLSSALGFAEKMTRIGYPTTVIQEASQQFYRAASATNLQFAIVISYSGETKAMLKVIKALKNRKVPVLLITGNADSPMIKYADYVLNIYSDEKLAMRQKEDSFGAQIAIHYLLDCIFSFVLTDSYEEHRGLSIYATERQFLFDD